MFFILASLSRLHGSSVIGMSMTQLGSPHRWNRSVTGKCHTGVTCEMQLWRLPSEKGGSAGPSDPPRTSKGGGGRDLLPYLVAVGAGAAVQLHRILATGPIVLAWAGEAGIALGHNADIHRPWTVKPQSVGGRPPNGLTVTPPFPSALVPSSASCQSLPISKHREQRALPGRHHPV